jgi:type IV conjugative transfer system coupling protein TraD
MALFRDVTRGGQIGFHFLSMFKQINQKLRYVALFLAVIIAVYLFYEMPREYLYDTFNYSNAYFWENLPKFHQNMHYKIRYITPSGKIIIVDARKVLESYVVKENIKLFKEYSITVLYASIAGMISLYIIAIFFFKRLGGSQRQSKIVRGAELVEINALIRMIKNNNAASDIKIGPLPIIKNTETNHIFLSGTTGSGKSNCIKSIIKQVRSRSQKMIIVDTTGEYVDFCYNKQCGDKILNPFDKSSETWNMWNDLDSKFDIDAFAEVLFPVNKIDNFWSTAPQLLFKSAFNKMKRSQNRSYKRLYNALAVQETKALQDFVKDTPAEPFFEKHNHKTLLSIRSAMIPYIQFLEYLPEVGDKSFSIKQWIENEDETGILFLLCSPKQRQTMSQLFTIWMDLAVRNIMELGTSQNRRIWFIIDELASLKKLPSLPVFLSEVRKFGGCGIIGIQSIHQISDIYGNDIAQTILNLFSTRLFFNCPEPRTQDWIIKSLGEQEEEKSIENFSYGAHEMRDGVSLTKQMRTRPLILGSELTNLEPNEAFVQLSRYPVSKVKIPIVK